MIKEVLRLDSKRRPWMVHVETWNEWHEGTDIAHSREYGRSYIVLTRLFTDLWHTNTHLDLPSGYVNAEKVSWEPGQPCGLKLRPSSGDGNWKQQKIDGVEAYAYNLLERTAKLCVTYRDAGCAQFAVEYDSMIQEGPFDGAFRPGVSVLIQGTGQWKTAEFELPDCRFMNRANGSDLRLVVTGDDLELAVCRVEILKPE